MKYEHIRLMPFQWEAFNGDTFIQNEFINLKERFNITTALELGTCLGSTAIWLSQNFDNVITIEINEQYAEIASERLTEAGCENTTLYVSSTTDALPSIELDDNTIIFIDSHWLEICPMQQELEIIAQKNIRPVIAIHDFYVPNEPTLGYDSINGQVFDFEWIKSKVDAIYGEDGYEFYYNSDAESTEIKRGIIYITPKSEK
jgi:hypothetical protein